jgi:hypothetical protein
VRHIQLISILRNDSMKNKNSEYTFKSELWKHSGPSGWCFVTLPSELSAKIRKNYSDSEEGWGRLKTAAKVGKTIWVTAIWFDTKHNSYLLPVKTEIRKKEKLAIGEAISIELNFSQL